MLHSLWLKGVLILKAMGIVRKVDQLGRIVIPIKLRRTLGIDIKDDMEIYLDKENIVIEKYKPACLFCDSTENVKSSGNRIVCKDCISKLVEE